MLLNEHQHLYQTYLESLTSPNIAKTVFNFSLQISIPVTKKKEIIRKERKEKEEQQLDDSKRRKSLFEIYVKGEEATIRQDLWNFWGED